MGGDRVGFLSSKMLNRVLFDARSQATMTIDEEFEALQSYAVNCAPVPDFGSHIYIAGCRLLRRSNQ